MRLSGLTNFFVVPAWLSLGLVALQQTQPQFHQKIILLVERWALPFAHRRDGADDALHVFSRDLCGFVLACFDPGCL
ncbi:MAG: hypothetical protein ACI957_002241, partial [Verrucomicrobiales bacterium]